MTVALSGSDRLGMACGADLRARPRRRAAAATLDAAERSAARVSAALARVGHELMRSLAKPALFEHLGRVATEVLASDASSTFLRDERTRSTLPVAMQGDARHLALLVDAKNPITISIRSRLAAESVVEVTLPVEGDPAGSTPSLWLCIALRRGSRLAGILVVGRTAGAPPFSHDDRRIADGIGRLASLALENARLVSALERANRVKADFVATMSHELRTPLHIILGYLSLLEEGDFGPVSAEQRDALDKIDHSARGLLALVDDTLDLSRLERDSLPVSRKDVHVAELLRSLENDVQKMPRPVDVALVWQAPDALVVHTDAGKLKIVLRSLISNALKFTAHGSITIAAQSCGDGVELSVADTGSGLHRADFSRIFEPFTQLGETSTRTTGGVGMGLYIARRITELLGGTIAVSSRLGVGSTFRVWIPTVAVSGNGDHFHAAVHGTERNSEEELSS